LRLVFGGDAMLGRLVGEAIDLHGPGYPLGQVARLLRAADLAVANLECAITASPRLWHGAPKAFYFGAPPAAARSLVDAGIGLVSLANNHTLDFNLRGLHDTLAALDAHGIAHAGAGASLQAALHGALVERKGVRIGMAAFCDHQDDFAAGPERAGIAWLDLHDEAAALRAFDTSLAALRAQGAHWCILSLHWGPNMVWRPALRYQRLAHAAVDMGWQILFGHSAHVFHGIEWRRGCPILYAAGDLVDDYYVDPGFHNDRQMLFELTLGQQRVERIRMTPLRIEGCRTVPAGRAERAWICGRMRELCAELGTCVHDEGASLVTLPQ
jgi:poly-gamma-glutamate synthesis protein (capsule biosynthesis protein)